ncbi:MAG: FAD-binding oxidoreductase [Clostridiales Family XIII bacterium]|nr:FAD-binding oxidoreductase [Clostridiales Family XIII bacterium]
MGLKEKTVGDLTEILGPESIISDDGAMRIADPIMVRTYAKAFGYVPEHRPLCIVKAASAEQVSKTLRYCSDNDIHVIARTGASSSEDQLLVIDDRTIFIDGSPMNRIVDIDTENMVVTAQCGTPIAALEERLNADGYTLGHAPQSLPLASMGGLVATRSTGQFSTYYGGIEDLVCGLEAVLPNGEPIAIRPVPRRAAGPDLRHIAIGSEGALVFITEVTVKIFKWYPDLMWKGGYIVENFKTGLAAVRDVMVKGYKPSVVRLYDKADVDHNYGSVKLKNEEAFMFFTVEGPGGVPEAHGAAIHQIALSYGAEHIGVKAVDHWFLTRNRICDTIGTEKEYVKFRETNVYNATLEICANWGQIGEIYDEAMRTLPEVIPELVMLGGHVSHSYMNGTNVYFVYALKMGDPASAHLAQYRFVDAVCDVVLKYSSATIVHHHGVGKMRAGRIREELGSSFTLLEMLKQSIDPGNIMNPGCLIPIG